jgi:hypothetical protein
MIRVKDIQNAFTSLVGFQKDGNYNLAEHLYESTSGLYIQGMHTMLTLSNIIKSAPTNLTVLGTQWTRQQRYYIDDIVVDSGIQYRAKANNLGMSPCENTTIWEVYTPLSQWVDSQIKASVSKAVYRFITDKSAVRNSKTLLENKYLFETTGRLTDTIANSNSIVGFEIQVPRYQSVSVQIKKIGLQMVGTGAVKMYVFHSSNVNAIREITLNRTRNGSIEWFGVEDLFLPYSSADTDAGGSWYLVYNQNELPANNLAINKQYDWAHGACSACNKIDYYNYTQWSKMITITPFRVQPSEDGTLWNIEDMVQTLDTNYGINLQVATGCDLTNFIVDNKNDFANVVAKQIAVDLLTVLYYNSENRININSQNGNYNTIYYDIVGDPSKYGTGMRSELEKAYKAIDLDTRGIDKICLPCGNKGIRVGSI